MNPIEKAAQQSLDDGYIVAQKQSLAYGSRKLVSSYDGPLYKVRHPEFEEVYIFGIVGTFTPPPLISEVFYDQSGNNRHIK